MAWHSLKKGQDYISVGLAFFFFFVLAGKQIIIEFKENDSKMKPSFIDISFLSVDT